jgi:hypothetical protein
MLPSVSSKKMNNKAVYEKIRPNNFHWINKSNKYNQFYLWKSIPSLEKYKLIIPKQKKSNTKSACVKSSISGKIFLLHVMHTENQFYIYANP